MYGLLGAAGLTIAVLMGVAALMVLAMAYAAVWFYTRRARQARVRKHPRTEADVYTPEVEIIDEIDLERGANRSLPSQRRLKISGHTSRSED
ncbi:MAG: hypothetical protein ISN29_10170 [Gammaproteobacteria bacterium AqS3]|nr:hypothetical protein [Gammaproteobacteria bacterium AqS3]